MIRTRVLVCAAELEPARGAVELAQACGAVELAQAHSPADVLARTHVAGSRACQVTPPAPLG